MLPTKWWTVNAVTGILCTMLVTVVSDTMQVYFLTHSFYHLCYPSLSLDCGYPALSGTISGIRMDTVWKVYCPCWVSHLDNTGSQQISVALIILVRRTQGGNLRHLRHCPYCDSRHPASCTKILVHHISHTPTSTSLSCQEDKCWFCDSSLSLILFILCSMGSCNRWESEHFLC